MPEKLGNSKQDQTNDERVGRIGEKLEASPDAGQWRLFLRHDFERHDAPRLNA